MDSSRPETVRSGGPIDTEVRSAGLPSAVCRPFPAFRNGRRTPDNYLFTIQSPDAAVVGRLWIAAKDRAGGRVAFIYDVSIKDEYRRRGYATLAFGALEDEVSAMGLAGIQLHVFGQNVVAQAPYAKLGYRPTNITMHKSVGTAGA